jgi:hypothetical protein
LESKHVLQPEQLYIGAGGGGDGDGDGGGDGAGGGDGSQVNENSLRAPGPPQLWAVLAEHGILHPSIVHAVSSFDAKTASSSLVNSTERSENRSIPDVSPMPPDSELHQHSSPFSAPTSMG